MKMKYLGHTKSSGSSLFFAYRKLEIIFFYRKIERRLLYFSMLFDHYSFNSLSRREESWKKKLSA
jgi:hypothetical protein